MCHRLCEVQEPLNATIAVLMNPVECLTTEEWQALKEITVVLKPFDAVTMEISAEMSVTASKVIMLARGLSTACHKILPTLTNTLSKALTSKLLEGMDVSKAITCWHARRSWTQGSKRRGLSLNLATTM